MVETTLGESSPDKYVNIPGKFTGTNVIMLSVKRQDLIEIFVQDNNSRSVLRVSDALPFFVSFSSDDLYTGTQ